MLKSVHMLKILRKSAVRTSYLQASFGTLLERHESFLHLVSSHGSGEVKQHVHHGGRVIELVLSNPSKRNAISGRMMLQLATAIEDITVNQSEVLCVVLRGCDSAGPAFCAGLDFSLAKDIVNTSVRGEMMCDFMTETLNQLWQSNIISVAYINGPALGGGAEIATSCDFRLMSDDSSSTLGFVHAKIGASPGWGGARRLMSIVGRSHTIRLLGTSASLSPAQCAAIGLVDEIVPSGVTTPWEDMLAPYLVQKYPNSVKAMKNLVVVLTEKVFEGAEKVEKSVFISRWGSHANKEAIRNRTKVNYY